MTKRETHSAEARLGEWPVWRKVRGVWRPLYGGFAERGVSLEWHEFQTLKSFRWSDSFHDRSLEICLNYTGSAKLLAEAATQELGNGQIAVYTTRGQLPEARREADSIHRFITLEFSADYLRRQFSAVLDGLHPDIQKFLENPDRFEPWLEVRELPATLLTIRMQMLEPPVNSAARDSWYQSKVLEVLAQTLFRPDHSAELFCQRHIRVNKERIERVKYLIERDLSNPPNLEMLAQEVECSSFYLSRLFAEETGISMPKYLRMKRVEKAADCLRTNGMSVTEAAMMVGYSSLSAFQKAFAERFGMSPGVYAAGKK